MDPLPLQRLAALVAPPVCVLCRAVTPPPRMLCAACEGEIRAMPPGRNDATVFAAFPYSGAVRSLIAALKFRGAPACARTMAELMRPRLPAWAEQPDCVVPAPAHPTRRRQRGFNQAALLARALAGAQGAPVVECLVRDPRTTPQSELSRAARLALAPRSIRLDARRLRQIFGPAEAAMPTNVLLCDDVVTTGVTLEACAQAIREGQPSAGIGSIRAVVFASVGRRG